MSGAPADPRPAEEVTVRAKWRPGLGLIVFSVLLAVLALPTTIVVGFRVFDGSASRLGLIEIGALAVALLLTLVIAYVLTRTITTPIHALVRRAEEIGAGGRAAIRPLDAYGTREIAVLAQSLLRLAGRLVDRSDYVRSFAAHVSHELRSPLTSIKGAAELLRDESADMDPAMRRRFLDNLVADADRLNALLARLREVAYAEVPLPSGQTNPAQIGAELARRFPDLVVDLEGDSAAPLALSPEAAAAIFGHLASNAAQHGASRLSLTIVPEADAVRLRVTDNGSGISPGNRALIFQPFFSTRREQGGTGMGLHIVRSMLGALGGSIALADSGAGASFEVRLPRADREGAE